ncbi:MAG: orotate phosphoribosyltransferase [Actinomycetota bacterium]
MKPGAVLELLERTGAVQRGHFRLASGRHSDVYAQKFRVLEHPAVARNLGEAIARSFEGKFEVVVSPAVGALVLGFTTALAAGARFIFTERVEGAMVLRRGFATQPGERVLVVEDVVTTGGSVREVLDLLDESESPVAGVGALIDRRDRDAPPGFAVPFRALLRLDAPTWDPGACPLCLGHEPITDPGSSRLTS